MSKVKILIGIDPDTEKSGFAFIDKSDLNVIQLKNLTFFELFSVLSEIKNTYQPICFDIQIYIECGFLNQGNRHKVLGGSLSLNSKIGERIGANHEVAKKICEMSDFLELKYFKIKPTRSKIKDNNVFKKITGYDKRTNQEQRDALMLIWGL
jgi:hypothetical protein